MQFFFLVAVLAMITLGQQVHAQDQPAPPFNLDNGDAVTQVLIPTIVPYIYSDISPTASDAPLVLRLTTLLTNALFDATAPYHPTAVGVYTRLDRQPEAEATPRNINIAITYSVYRVMNAFLPRRMDVWRKIVEDLGLDPDDNSMDPTTPVGIGNLAGMGVVRGRSNDGMNQLGNEYNRTFNPLPYGDYTGYTPVNTAHKLLDPSRWQPDLQIFGAGLYKIQQFVTPQYALVEPYSYESPEAYSVPAPLASDHSNFALYKAQADHVLRVSRGLTDEQKVKAELFDDKIRSLGFSAIFMAQSRGLSPVELIQLDFLNNLATFDAGIFVWQEKRRWDAVRPFSAIRYIYGDNYVSGWAGPGKGTLSLPASQWRSYLEEADHPEYPSASACFCEAHAQSMRRYFGSDALGYPVEVKAGMSRIEPGVTPAKDLTVIFPTWTDFSSDCGQSRVWAGVHFQAAVDESQAVCKVFGDMAYDYWTQLMDGTARPRAPSDGR